MVIFNLNSVYSREMVERIKTALYNMALGGGGAPQDVVGTTLQIPLESQAEAQNLKVKRILDTGGYGIIYLAQDTKTGREFAIKRIIAAREQIPDIKRELQLHQSLTGHLNILPFITAVSQKLSDSAGSPLVYLIQTELCPYGNICSVLPLPGTNRYLSLPHIFKFFYQTVLAVSHLHSQSPPIVHRDLKAENLLLDAGENIRLCDFGSATTEFHHPDTSWTATQRGLLQEDLARYTTPMYRAPEMLDLYSNQPIDTRADIWALGCLLYHICFLRHPFQEGSTLPILSAQYFFPEVDSYNKEPMLFQTLIRSLIKPLPDERPTADGVIASLFHYSTQIQFDLDALDKVPKLLTPTPTPPLPPTPAADPSQPQAAEIRRESSPSSHYSGLNAFLGRVREGADSLLKNIKESAQQHLRGAPLPLLHITTRLLICVVVPDERNALAMREVLERDHDEGYLIFNLSGVTYDVALFNGRVADLVWPRVRPTPEFLKMLDMCKQVDAWLRADPSNVVVLQDLPDLTSAIYLTLAFLLYSGLFSSLRSVGTFLTEQLPPSIRFLIIPSLKRYYSYVTRLVKDPDVNRPHRKRVCIKGVRVSPCRFKEDTELVLEILCRDGVVYSSQGEGGLVLSAENAVEFTPHVEVESDVQVKLHSPNNKAAVITTNSRTLVCSLQLYSGYMSAESGVQRFLLKDVDLNHSSSIKPHALSIQLTFEVSDSREFICPIESVIPTTSSPPSCCSSREECESLRQIYEMTKNTKFTTNTSLANPYVQQSQTAPSTRPPLPNQENDPPLISIGSDEPSTNPQLPPHTEKPPIPHRPKFKDTMDQDSSSSSSSSNSSSSSSTTSSDEYQHADLNPDTDITTAYSLIGEEFNAQEEPLISTDTAPPVNPTLETRQSPSPTQTNPVPPQPSTEPLISGFSDLTVTHPPAGGDLGELLDISPQINRTQHSPNPDLDDLFDVLPNKSNTQIPKVDLLTSKYPDAPIDPVMVPNGNAQKTTKSNDPWDLFDMNSLSSKDGQSDLFENKHAKLSSNEPQVRRVPTPTNTSKPNYTSATTSQQPSRNKGDPFGDILEQSGFPKHKDETHTLNELNRANLVEVIGDPDKVRVMEWSKSKRGNIRALLSSLHEMAWDGVRWKPLGMHEIMEPKEVKKAYLKASLAFHPDKHVDSPYQNLGRLIIIELNESHTRFEASGKY